MFKMDFKVEFDNQYKLGLIAEIEIECSVDNLVDTATITLPEAVMNKVVDFQSKIKRGSFVSIELGYDGTLKKEFEGYVQEIITNDSSLKIVCEDALFLFRKNVKDVELKATDIKKIVQLLIDQIDPSFTLNCDYIIPYEKFIIHQATGYDVLKKLQEETRANIYFDTKNKTLHIHGQYLEKLGEVKYSMQHNVEKSSLEYKTAIDKKVEVTIEGVDLKGKVTSYTTGTTGGEKITRKVGTIPQSGIKIMAETEYNNQMSDGYTGSFDAWLIPFVQPTYTAIINDDDYPYKNGRYYVIGVKTNFSESGGKRTITPGIKL
jgi:hypothetical protein